MIKTTKTGKLQRWMTASLMGGSTLLAVPATSTGGCSAQDIGMLAAGVQQGYMAGMNGALGQETADVDPYGLNPYGDEADYGGTGCNCPDDYADDWGW